MVLVLYLIKIIHLLLVN